MVFGQIYKRKGSGLSSGRPLLPRVSREGIASSQPRVLPDLQEERVKAVHRKASLASRLKGGTASSQPRVLPDLQEEGVRAVLKKASPCLTSQGREQPLHSLVNGQISKAFLSLDEVFCC
jgi:hypothetical protein